MKIEIDVQYLRECFDYNRETGVLTWRPRPQRHFPKERDRLVFNALFAGKVAGYKNDRGYVVVRILGRQWRAHRIAWAIAHGRMPLEMIDHINGITDDNRIANLREADRCQNQWNSKVRADSSTGIKGAAIRSDGLYTSSISIRGRYKYLGTFRTAEQAHQAYLEAARENFGVFANDGQIDAARAAKGE